MAYVGAFGVRLSHYAYIWKTSFIWLTRNQCRDCSTGSHRLSPLLSAQALSLPPSPSNFERHARRVKGRPPEAADAAAANEAQDGDGPSLFRLQRPRFVFNKDIEVVSSRSPCPGSQCAAPSTVCVCFMLTPRTRFSLSALPHPFV